MAYKMGSDPHGYCIIFNNSFTEGKRRKGTCKDSYEIKKLFKDLKYTVIILENFSAKEMLNYLIQINKDEKNQCFDSFICCFLSYGDENTIHGHDGKSSLPYTAIWSLFGQESSTLRSKPKVFITQSCQEAVTPRLTIGDQRVGTEKVYANSRYNMETHDVKGLNTEFDQGLGTDHADILFIKASVPGKLFHMSAFY